MRKAPCPCIFEDVRTTLGPVITIHSTLYMQSHILLSHSISCMLNLLQLMRRSEKERKGRPEDNIFSVMRTVITEIEKMRCQGVCAYFYLFLCLLHRRQVECMMVNDTLTFSMHQTGMKHFVYIASASAIAYYNFSLLDPRHSRR